MLRAAVMARMARPPAVTMKRGYWLLLAASALTCLPAAGPGVQRSASGPSNAAGASDAAPAGAASSEPVNREQLDLRARFGSAAALGSEQGEASYYSDALAGRSTASGEAYDPMRFTAAHRKLPFGTHLRVTRKDDGRSVYVRVNDRGPFGRRRRIIDLSRSAAEALGMMRQGVADVKVEVVERVDARAAR